MALNSGGGPGAAGGVVGLGRVSAGDTKSIAQWKQFFFDRPAVVKAMGRATTTALNRFGGYVRSVARRSMRRRKNGHSQPGQPPFAKSGELRDLLFYAYDPKTRSVVVGPLGFRTRSGLPVPALHEFGGTRTGRKGETMDVKNPVGRDPKTGRFYSRGFYRVSVEGKVLKFPPRPFMNPALKASIPRFALMFKGTVSR